jgi:hypothetical protein
MKAFLAIAALFFVLVLSSFYYILGGPIPHTISWESRYDSGFSGRYAVVGSDTDQSLSELLDNGKTVEGNLPASTTFWASRYAVVAAELTLEQADGTYNTITIRRAGIPCAIGYQYGTTMSTRCGR